MGRIIQIIVAVIFLTPVVTVTAESPIPEYSNLLLLDITSAGSRAVAVGDRGTVIHYDKGDKEWKHATNTISQMLTAVDFPNSNQGWAVGHDGVIITSSDSGQTWQTQANPTQDALTAIEEKIRHIDARILRGNETGDANLSAEALPPAQLKSLRKKLLNQKRNIYHAPLMDVTFDNSQQGWVVGAFGEAYATADGGESWQSFQQQLPNEDELHLNAIAQQGDVLCIAGEYGIVFISPDRGESWHAANTPYDGSLFSASIAADSNVITVAGLQGSAFRSTDLGETWEKLALRTTKTLNFTAVISDTENIFVGSGGTVIRSVRHSATQKNFSAYTLPGRQALSAALHQDNSIIVVGEGGVHVVPKALLGTGQ